MKILFTTLLLSLAALPKPAAAGLLSIDVAGVLGPVLQGADPINLAGSTFTATGAIDSNAIPISVSGDTAVYALPGTLQITLGQGAFTGYNALLSIIAPSFGPDTAVLDFSLFAFNTTPDATATFLLNEGTFNGTGIQSFSANVIEPDGSLGYSIAGATDNLTGTLGITGSVSVGGVQPSGVPEPGTFGLLTAGLLAAIGLKMRGRRGSLMG